MNYKVDYKKAVKLTGISKEILKAFITYEVNNKFIKQENIESLILFLAFCKELIDFKTIVKEFYGKSPAKYKDKSYKFQTLLTLVASKDLVQSFKKAYTNNSSSKKGE